MNVVLPAGANAGESPRVLLPYFWGDPSCWPQCPQRGLVLSVDPATSNVTALTLLPAVTDGIGECGAWSVGRSAAGTADSRQVLVLASSGLLFAFAPDDFVTPRWTYSVANPLACDVVAYNNPVSDSAGNVYVAWGSLIAAVDARGTELWRCTLPQGASGALVVAQVAAGLDGTLFVTYVELAGGGGGGGAAWVPAAY